LWKRFLLGAVLIVFGTASATAVAAFREVDQVLTKLRESPSLHVPVAPVDPGEPQTIMLLGSDKRPANTRDGSVGAGARSDTIILARLDPDRRATALMSLPRDLKVQIPGHGTAKINAAYEIGGPGLVVRTVRQLTGLEVHHVINVDFGGFKAAIDAIGCVYLDVDRRYFNDSPGYAYIDVKQGYQKLCGEEALEYARFRHEDSDLVRAARQQQLLREAKQQVGVLNLLGQRDKLRDILGNYTRSDAALKSTAGLLRVLKLAAALVSHPVRDVPFEGMVTSGNEATNTPSYVEARPSAIRRLTARFLRGGESASPRRRHKRPRRLKGDGGLESAPAAGKEQAVQAIKQGAGGQLPVYYPTVLVKGSLFEGPPRYYKIPALNGSSHKSYRMVIRRGRIGDYYGVQGTTWKEPPILESPSERRKVGRRSYELYYDGDRLRIAAWRTHKAVYWVSNTLLNSLSERQMLAIAHSMRLP
jgi:LCP family protein required for cell wall assembly